MILQPYVRMAVRIMLLFWSQCGSLIVRIVSSTSYIIIFSFRNILRVQSPFFVMRKGRTKELCKAWKGYGLTTHIVNIYDLVEATAI